MEHAGRCAALLSSETRTFFLMHYPTRLEMNRTLRLARSSTTTRRSLQAILDDLVHVLEYSVQISRRVHGSVRAQIDRRRHSQSLDATARGWLDDEGKGGGGDICLRFLSD